MKCEDIMRTEVECVSPPTSIQMAAGLMREANTGFLPVCEEGLRVVGTLTDRTIITRAVAEGRPLSTPVEDLMSREIIACRGEDDIEYALELMLHHQKSNLLCVNRNGRLEGMISLSDIAQLDASSGLVALHRVSRSETREDR